MFYVENKKNQTLKCRLIVITGPNLVKTQLIKLAHMRKNDSLKTKRGVSLTNRKENREI